MTEEEKAYQYFVIAVPENEEQAKAYFWARKALQPTLTPPNEWVSVYDRLPEPGERVLATDCGFVGEFYINKRGKWQRYNVNCSELLMALDILYWMSLPAPPDKDNNVLAKTPNEPLTQADLDSMDYDKVWIDYEDGTGEWALVCRGYIYSIDTLEGAGFDFVDYMRGERLEPHGYKVYRRPPEGEA
jgi:hypothetical protein